MARTIATTTRVDLPGLVEFARTRHDAVLTTFRRDGSLQSSPITCGVTTRGQDGDGGQARFVVSTYPDRAKAVNLRRDPRASLVVLSAGFGNEWVQVDGTAQVIDGEDAVEPLVEYFRCISGEHPDWAEYRQAMRDQGKSLISITPTRWGPIATGGFPARLA
ncbi:PPOX class probable F420-dependent enzyme [Quadrisphaera granulorum]|uniref:PPOX class probable F420-dependent enzyme n=1 Tax=Quadrisphaera granulorum TaxID=317664 RepID=A0A316ABS1_9ACTN|nr:PPOX class F420-dependent oxidoreductase [Quadrisphaera granulorum]PWJ54708.1 PPOX class probable F420-dependent enzyme [Quadrisphaera granulorum]SZE96070.1 PPOX class probable F420-dependent enzyme [Quadrisphaera granulorum]